MIVQELINEKTVRTYSDAGFYIYGGFPPANYIEAIDPIDQRRKYVETDMPIIKFENTEEETQTRDEHLSMKDDQLMVQLAQEENNKISD